MTAQIDMDMCFWNAKAILNYTYNEMKRKRTGKLGYSKFELQERAEE